MLLLAPLVLALAPPVAQDDGFVPLFNGRDLSGWVPVNTAPSTWSVTEEGYLHCTGKPIGELRTERMYQNFVLEVEWRHMVSGGNAGIFVWADDITAPGVPFHRSIEVQVLDHGYGQGRGHTTHGDIFPIHGATLVPLNHRGGMRAFPVEERSKPSPEWNHYRITCIDGAITLAVNGAVVTRGSESSLRKGYICLESEGGIVDYRNLRIRELPDTEIAPEHIAIADRGYRSLYTGVDLSGWQVNDAARQAWKVRDWQLAFTGNPEPGTDVDLAIATEEAFDDFGFIVDVRLTEKSGAPRLVVGGHQVRLDRADETLPDGLKLGWTRIYGRLHDDRLDLSFGGERAWLDVAPAIDPPDGPQPLRLAPDEGPVEFANLFVRAVD